MVRQLKAEAIAEINDIEFSAIEERVRTSTITRAEATLFAKFFCRDIVHTAAGKALCKSLTDALNAIAAGPDYREKAAELMRLIRKQGEMRTSH